MQTRNQASSNFVRKDNSRLRMPIRKDNQETSTQTNKQNFGQICFQTQHEQAHRRTNKQSANKPDTHINTHAHIHTRGKTNLYPQCL